MANSTLHVTWKLARRLVIAVVGLTVLGIGIVLIVLPGPALLVIPVGLAILGLEFAWARAWLHRVRRGLSRRAIEDIGRRGSDTRIY
ncbi:MAG: PGPGW domain-containing protein [Gammaproteobacteria bacterium]|jgi:tellurite resistance protein TerC